MSILGLILAILIFSFIIISHEFGHFIAAKSCNVKVNEFSLGFGPRLLGFTIGETRYSLKLLPLGGSCAMEGEAEESDDVRSFGRQNVWKRIIIVAAGPLANFLVAFLASLILIGMFGFDRPVVYDVVSGSPAEAAGIEAGDEIVKLNGRNIRLFREISIYNQVHQGKKTQITYLHEGKKHTVSLQPEADETGWYMIGVTGGAREQGKFTQTVRYAGYEMRYQILTCIDSLGALVTGSFGVKDLSGPVGITATIGQVYEESRADGARYIFGNLLMIATLLSANLGVMNLLPFPALDGGRILMGLGEAATRRRLSPKIENAVNAAGFSLLMILMVFIMINDVIKLF